MKIRRSNGNSFAEPGSSTAPRNPESTEHEGCPLTYKYMNPVQDIL